jgi:hypothetical protein
MHPLENKLHPPALTASGTREPISHVPISIVTASAHGRGPRPLQRQRSLPRPPGFPGIRHSRGAHQHRVNAVVIAEVRMLWKLAGGLHVASDCASEVNATDNAEACHTSAGRMIETRCRSNTSEPGCGFCRQYPHCKPIAHREADGRFAAGRPSYRHGDKRWCTPQRDVTSSAPTSFEILTRMRHKDEELVS